jgi:hypothetical protein
VRAAAERFSERVGPITRVGNRSFGVDSVLVDDVPLIGLARPVATGLKLQLPTFAGRVEIGDQISGFGPTPAASSSIYGPAVTAFLLRNLNQSAIRKRHSGRYGRKIIVVISSIVPPPSEDRCDDEGQDDPQEPRIAGSQE